MSAAGSRLLDRWLAGELTDDGEQAKKLRSQLIRAGIVHPVPCDRMPPISTTFVVPVYDDAAGLDRLLAALRSSAPDAAITVVDDASADAASIAQVATRHTADLVRHDTNRGPAAARNTGWRHVSASSVQSPGVCTLATDVIVFIDADVVPQAGAVQTMLAHFADPEVAAVAPRVMAAPGTDRIAAYEVHDSPLDMGDDAAIVFPGTRLSYVPSAMMAIRFNVLDTARGFDEGMRYGEDVDLVWRLIHDGHVVRYEPRSLATHRNRASLRAFAKQRFTYGSSAASLAARHGDKVAPLQLPASTVAATLAMLFGNTAVRTAGFAGAVASAVPLARKLEGKVDEANSEALRLTAMMHGYALQGLATAATRSWVPLLLPASRLRRSLAAALIIPALIDWIRNRPASDAATHLALRAVDHGSYCAGVWSGVVRARSIAALLPRLRLRS